MDATVSCRGPCNFSAKARNRSRSVGPRRDRLPCHRGTPCVQALQDIRVLDTERLFTDGQRRFRQRLRRGRLPLGGAPRRGDRAWSRAWIPPGRSPSCLLGRTELLLRLVETALLIGLPARFIGCLPRLGLGESWTRDDAHPNATTSQVVLRCIVISFILVPCRRDSDQSAAVFSWLGFS